MKEDAGRGKTIFLVPPLDGGPAASTSAPLPASGPSPVAETPPEQDRVLGAVGCTRLHRRWWRGRGQVHWVCEVCHAPVRERLVAERSQEPEPLRRNIRAIASELS